MMSPCKLLLMLILFVLLQTICEAGLLPAKFTVNISNYHYVDIMEIDLTVHCKSGEDDLGEHTEDFVALVKEETGGKGVNVILDCVGTLFFQQNLDSLDFNGRLFIIGIQVEAKTELNKAEMISEVEKYVWPAITAGEVKPVIHKYFRLSEAAEAHPLMESSQKIGKIILVP
ncbi:hypothetical protein LWI28_002563 [Acer negundo]|uniref:Uncharacterized protein n=1 Tax=Acer negundo TaxID=4023 RepID=A0AAD5JP18_ACENE|nr:hypothetical protein LWI28_002563 [Acer negundo]